MKHCKLSFVLIGLTAIAVSCTQAIVPETPEIYRFYKAQEGQIILGEKLANPYSIDNMRLAAASLGTKADGTEIEPNWLYVRFLPKDSTDLRIIESMDLFCYPLDYEVLQEGTEYHDPDIPEDQITWMYTRIRPDYEIPQTIQYEILEECYIPEYDEETKSPESAFARELERRALEQAGYKTIETKASAKSFAPTGTVQVYDDERTSSYVPVKGVKVQCHHIVKFATAYTDENGRYTMSTAFQTDPKYTLVFENTKGFTIWDGIMVAAPASANYGKGPARGMDIKVIASDKAWKWAALTNGGYDFYKRCEKTGMALPPKNLKIMSFGGKGDAYGSATMLRRIPAVRIDSNSRFVDVVSNIAVIPCSALVLLLTKLAMPDLIFFHGWMSNAHYHSVICHISHELTHASHFSTAGAGFWFDFASIIMTNGFGYGPKSHEHSDIVDLGESWAIANENYINGTTSTGGFDSGEDFNWRILGMLLNTGIMSQGDISRCLTKDVRSIDQLIQKLMSTYPKKANDIKRIYKIYAI